MPRRRYLTFSLRSLFVLTTALAVWLGIVVNRAREQREAVKAIEVLGGTVWYDWEKDRHDPFDEPGGPAWLRRLIGDDYFQSALEVEFGRTTPDADVEKLIPQLRRLRRLESVEVRWSMWNETLNKLKTALPSCEVRPVFLNENYFSGKRKLEL